MRRFYAALLAGGELDGVRLLGEATVREMTRPHAEGHDLLLDWDIRWGLGVQIEPTGEWGIRDGLADHERSKTA